MSVREIWKEAARQTRLLIAEWLMYRAIVVAPKGSRLERELAKFFLAYIPKAMTDDGIKTRKEQP